MNNKLFTKGLAVVTISLFLFIVIQPITLGIKSNIEQSNENKSKLIIKSINADIEITNMHIVYKKVESDYWVPPILVQVIRCDVKNIGSDTIDIFQVFGNGKLLLPFPRNVYYHNTYYNLNWKPNETKSFDILFIPILFVKFLPCIYKINIELILYYGSSHNHKVIDGKYFIWGKNFVQIN